MRRGRDKVTALMELSLYCKERHNIKKKERLNGGEREERKDVSGQEKEGGERGRKTGTTMS